MGKTNRRRNRKKRNIKNTQTSTKLYSDHYEICCMEKLTSNSDWYAWRDSQVAYVYYICKLGEFLHQSGRKYLHLPTLPSRV